MAENPEPDGKPIRSPIQRRAAAAAAAEPEPSPEPTHFDQMASLADSVKLLASQLHASRPSEPPAPSERVLRRRTINRFQRRAESAEGTDAPPADLPPGEGEDAPEGLAAPEAGEAIDDFDRNRNIAWPRSQPPASPARRKKRSTTVPMLVLMGCNLAMLVFGLFLGQSAAPATNTSKDARATPGVAAVPVDALGPQSVNDRVLATINKALKDEKAGDLDVARRAYNEAVARRVGLPGAEYRLALLAIQRGDIVDADLHLVHSTKAGEMVAGCDYIRATFAGSQGNFGEAGRQLEGATRAEPFNGKWYFCWGECLRRQGKPQAALTALQQALDRPFSRDEGNLYFFKLGLAQIEAGGGEEFNASLDQHLQQKGVSGDWLLLAAARELDHAAYPAAAEYLAKAEKVMTPDLFESRVQDYFFRAHANSPDVATYLSHPSKPETTEAGQSIMDPASWTPERADPGSWPTSAPGH